MRLYKEFLLWSNIICPIFKSPYINATSAAVEGDFALVKTNILKQMTTPMIVDRFLVTHLKSIEGSIKIVRSGQVQKYSFKETTSKQNNYNEVEELAQQVGNTNYVTGVFV